MEDSGVNFFSDFWPEIAKELSADFKGGGPIVERMEINRELLAEIPRKAGLNVLVTSAGAGYDAEMFAKLGCHVTASERSRMLRGVGMQAFPGSDISWQEEDLPKLAQTSKKEVNFDIITMNDNLQYLSPEDRQESLRKVFSLVAKNGHIGIQYPESASKEFQYVIKNNEIKDFVDLFNKNSTPGDRINIIVNESVRFTDRQDLDGKPLSVRTFVLRREK